MNNEQIDFSNTYLKINFELGHFFIDRRLDKGLFHKLSIAWGELNLPDQQGNLRTEVELLNARLILLFFDAEFRKDLKNTVDAYVHLNEVDGTLLRKLENLELEVLSFLLPNEGLDKAKIHREKLHTNWGVKFDFLPDNTFNLTSIVYGITDFNLGSHNRRLQLLLKENPNTSSDIVSEMRFDGGERHLLGVDLKYNLETNLKLFERKLLALYAKEDMVSMGRNKGSSSDQEAEAKFFSPQRISNLFSVQPQHRHFNIHHHGMILVSEDHKLKADTVANKICDLMKEKGTFEVNSLAKIIKDLPRITRPFHHHLTTKRAMIYSL